MVSEWRAADSVIQLFCAFCCFCGVCCCFCWPVSSLQMMCWSEWWMTALPQTSSCWPVTVVQFMLCLSAQTELISSPLRRMEQVSVLVWVLSPVDVYCLCASVAVALQVILWGSCCRVLAYFCCNGRSNHSVGSCVFLLLWPSRSLCGILVYFCCCDPSKYTGGSCIFLLLWPSRSLCQILVYFCCCYPSNYSVGFWCISVAVTLQMIL